LPAAAAAVSKRNGRGRLSDDRRRRRTGGGIARLSHGLPAYRAESRLSAEDTLSGPPDHSESYSTRQHDSPRFAPASFSRGSRESVARPESRRVNRRVMRFAIRMRLARSAMTQAFPPHSGQCKALSRRRLLRVSQSRHRQKSWRKSSACVLLFMLSMSSCG